MINQTIFSEKLAREIVKSWSRSGSNYILIAPPLSNARSLLKRICETELITSVHGVDASVNYSVAELDTSDFKDDLTFALRVLRGWQIMPPKFSPHDDAVSLLNFGTQCVIDKGYHPIIVIHRFHEALTKLGEDIGTALRNLEHDYNLSTVVELPVSITCLRQRWSVSLNAPPPFLASDWGQGHSEKFVKGLTQQEVAKLLPEIPKRDEMAKTIYSLTAGLPGLVDKLLVAAESRDPTGLTNFARSQASKLCVRLVQWVDKPGDDFFKRLLVKTVAHSNSNDITSLLDHDWADLFRKSEPSLGIQMLVWACNNEIMRDSASWYIQQMQECFIKGTPEDFDLLLDSVEIAKTDMDHGKYQLSILKRFSDAINPFDADWVKVAKILDEFTGFCLSHESDSATYLNSYFSEWKILCKSMNSFRVEADKTGVRLEQFSLSSGSNEITLALIDFLEIRLNFAKNNFTPYVAMKSVVEMPETILQIYSYLVCGIRFWDFDTGNEYDVKKISQLIHMDFKMPRPRAQLSFFEILCLIYVKTQDISAQSRLFQTFEEFSNIQKIYEERKRQVHSTALIEHIDWTAYEKFCRGWLAKIRQCAGAEGRAKPRSPHVVFDDLLKRVAC
ncbi:hypothetical protein [Massilia phyllosphaerae]|uniref:hypothetical protein n=1 Tax=Massilia phyllosphaerae TaxID=3106034 RepID=UPI002B1CBB07|nr:hypothetical protein [Massilia sp. SGZ-792]